MKYNTLVATSSVVIEKKIQRRGDEQEACAGETASLIFSNKKKPTFSHSSSLSSVSLPPLADILRFTFFWDHGQKGVRLAWFQ